MFVNFLLFLKNTCVYLAWQNFYCTNLYFFHVCTPSSFSEEVVFNSFLEWLLSVFAKELFIGLRDLRTTAGTSRATRVQTTSPC